MNPSSWCPTFSLYSVPQVQYQLSCLESRYINIINKCAKILNTCYVFNKLFHAASFYIPTDMLPGNILSVPEHQLISLPVP